MPDPDAPGIVALQDRAPPWRGACHGTSDRQTRVGTCRRRRHAHRHAAQNWYDVWFPTLAPSAATMKLGQEAQTPQDWAAFVRKYKAEMNEPEPGHALNLLATLSHSSDFSVGCYCVSEERCHRSLLRQLLADRGASIV